MWLLGRVATDERACTDVNECANGTHHCLGVCRNTVGSFTCECNTSNREQPNATTGACENYNECLNIDQLCGDGCCEDLEARYERHQCLDHADG